MEEKRRHLESILAAHAPLMIAYSGGVDSACLVAVAHHVLGDRMQAVIADSPSLPRAALADAITLAEQIGAPLRVIVTDEMENADYVSNPSNRCYFCKAELFGKMSALARDGSFAALAYGENADDATMDRPGRKAADEFAVLSPLREAGLSKAEIRTLSHELGLPTANAPAQPCLSSRIPHGTDVTAEALQMVEKAEAFVRSLGFRVFRVRHIVDSSPGDAIDPGARVAIAPDELERVDVRLATTLAAGLKEVGYGTIEIDPDGYR